LYPNPTQDTTEIEEITRFWRHVFGGQSGLLWLWTAVYNKNGDRTKIKEESFDYPEASKEAAQWALKKSEEEGREVYFCAHLLTAEKRDKENAAEVVTLWGDLDGADVPNGELTPTGVVESSPGKFHCYWRLSAPVLPEDAEKMNKRLAQAVAADPSGYDLTQLLRVPGTTNNKYPDKPKVTLKGLDGARQCSLVDLCGALPEVEEPKPVDVEEEDGPPVELSEKALKVWRGEEPVLKDDGKLDRSLSLLQIGRVLYDAGANRRVVVEALKERDISLGWEKYSDRRDGGDKEYNAIFDELKDKGRNTRWEVTVKGKKIRRAKNASEGADSSDSSDSSDSFSGVSSFTKTPEFPVDALPKKCARYVREAAASLDCPPELVGLPVLCALSGALGHTRTLRIKQGWEVSANLYAAVVDEPGSRKSPAQSLAYKPLQKLQVKLREDYKEQRKLYEEEMREHAVEKKKAAKEDRAEPEPPQPPKMKRCIVDDITIEALAMRLEENPRGFLSAQDELSGFIRGMDQYKSGGKGNTRQSYLKMWSNIAIYVDRKGSNEPVIIPSPYVTLQGAIQPGVLHELAGGREDGFLDRFIFAYPDPTPGGYTDETVSTTAVVEYERVINALWNKQPGADADGNSLPPSLTMDRTAKALFVSTVNALAREKSSPGFPASLQGPWAKFDTHLARLALIIATTRSAEAGGETTETVSGDDMRNAVRLLEYFKATTRKVCGQLFEADPDEVLAADLVTVLKDTGYVYSGTVLQLMEQIDSVALPDTPEALGRALRRIARSSPHLQLESKSTGKERIITITLKKLSELSELSAEGEAETSDQPPGDDKEQEDQSDPLEAFLADPPEWFRDQAAGCWYDGQLDESRVGALASAVFQALLEGPAFLWYDVRPAVERWLRAGEEPLKKTPADPPGDEAERRRDY
jgi:Protein of unknown function (DUF3987)/RepB DNA-primase from phage plasmid